MSLAEGLYAHLSAHAGLAALIGTRAYPIELPEDPTYPCLTYEEQEGNYIGQFSADPSAATVPVEFLCWAETDSGARAVSEQVYAALHRHSGAMGSITALVCLVDGPPSLTQERLETDSVVWLARITVNITYEL